MGRNLSGQPRRAGRAAVTAVCGLLALGCATAGAVIEGTGGIVEQARAMPYFTAVHVAGAYDVRVVAGATPDVTIHADASLLPYIETSVKGDTLSIGTKRGAVLHPTSTPRLDVFTRDVNAIAVAGTADLVAEHLAGDSLVVQITGNGRGALSGAIRTLRIQVSGTAAVDARDLTADAADVAISGVGDVTLTARDRLTVDLSGTGRVRYAGRPAHITERVSGNGQVLPFQ
ncbi:MAG TPA: head GIN domain-containing protein [bacterium]|nr:head GIN domain-containing protein [bacterium]